MMLYWIWCLVFLMLMVRSAVQHMLSKHSQTYCASCMRYFKTVGALGDHYRDSPVHPRCSPCDLGFKDKAAYDEVRILTYSVTAYH